MEDKKYRAGKTSIVRIILLSHVLVAVWHVTGVLEDSSYSYWPMLVGCVPLFIEAFWAVIWRDTNKYFLVFSPSFFFYLLAILPCVWLLELRRTDVYMKENPAKTIIPIIETLGLERREIKPNIWTILLEEQLPLVLIICRWIQPRGEIGRKQLSKIIFAFIGIASDITVFLSLSDIWEVRRNSNLFCIMLLVWSLSLLQFCTTITVTHFEAQNVFEFEPKVNSKLIQDLIVLVLSMIIHDIPFLIVRLYIIIKYDVISYTLTFFTVKNWLVILLLFYKMILLMPKCEYNQSYCDAIRQLSSSNYFSPFKEETEYNGLITIGNAFRIEQNKPPFPNQNEVCQESKGKKLKTEKLKIKRKKKATEVAETYV